MSLTSFSPIEIYRYFIGKLQITLYSIVKSFPYKIIRKKYVLMNLNTNFIFLNIMPK